jgi:hypothetical protein
MTFRPAGISTDSDAVGAVAVPRRTNVIIVAGRLHVDHIDRDHYVAECVAVVEQARTAPGCLDFAITADSGRGGPDQRV